MEVLYTAVSLPEKQFVRVQDSLCYKMRSLPSLGNRVSYRFPIKIACFPMEMANDAVKARLSFKGDNGVRSGLLAKQPAILAAFLGSKLLCAIATQPWHLDKVAFIFLNVFHDDWTDVRLVKPLLSLVTLTVQRLSPQHKTVVDMSHAAASFLLDASVVQQDAFIADNESFQEFVLNDFQLVQLCDCSTHLAEWFKEMAVCIRAIEDRKANLPDGILWRTPQGSRDPLLAIKHSCINGKDAGRGVFNHGSSIPKNTTVAPFLGAMVPKDSRADTSYFLSPWFGCNFVIDGTRSITEVETAMATWDKGSLHNAIGSFVNSQEGSPNCTIRWLPLTDIRAKKKYTVFENHPCVFRGCDEASSSTNTGVQRRILRSAEQDSTSGGQSALQGVMLLVSKREILLGEELVYWYGDKGSSHFTGKRDEGMFDDTPEDTEPLSSEDLSSEDGSEEEEDLDTDMLDPDDASSNCGSSDRC